MHKKILLVDRSKTIRDALSVYFESEECEFIALETAEKALTVLQNQTYDIVIAEYSLPGLNGLELLKQIQVSHPDTVKILITSYNNKKIHKEAKEAGVEKVICKPFSAEYLSYHIYAIEAIL